MERVNECLAVRRKKARKSIKYFELAKTIGVSVSTLSGKMKGKSDFPLDEVLLVKDVLGGI